MNSNFKLLSAGLLVAVLALAGCGGGSSDDTMTPPPPPTPEEACESAGDNWHEGACYTDQELIDLGVEQGKKDAADAAEEARKAEEAKKAAAAMMATALKLHTGISAPTATDATPEVSIRFAAYNDDEDAINVQNGVVAAEAEELSEDKKAMITALHGWNGKKYTASGTGVDGTYEAVVYSNVGDPTEGDPFNEEYTLADGAVAIDTSAAATPGSRVASSSFDQSAGLKRFKLPDPNPGGATKITVSGSYHGVSGTYTCTPGDGNTCVSRVAASGFDLGVVDASDAFTVGSWTFKPTTPTTKVMSVPDDAYASYGWWLHKSADDKTYTASAFVDEKGTVGPASDVGDLRGTATYSGGAAGKYALHSATGGTNDAGHFTARATLEADFNTDMVSGTIDNFMGADGQSRDWSVALKKSAIGDTGLIRRSDDDNSDLAATDPGAMTEWTIGGTAAAAAGQWSGSLRNNGDDGVPSVATGTFHSEYSNTGRMIGAFGATK